MNRKEKMREYQAKYREKNLETLRQRARDRYASDPKKAIEYQKRWRKKNPDKRKRYVQAWISRNPDYAKSRALEKRYGISISDRAEMIAKQNGICAICPEPLTRPHVDHDHSTGAIRGVLCKPCNQGLGFFRENADILRSAIRYLEAER